MICDSSKKKYNFHRKLLKNKLIFNNIFDIIIQEGELNHPFYFKNKPTNQRIHNKSTNIN